MDLDGNGNGNQDLKVPPDPGVGAPDFSPPSIPWLPILIGDFAESDWLPATACFNPGLSHSIIDKRTVRKLGLEPAIQRWRWDQHGLMTVQGVDGLIMAPVGLLEELQVKMGTEDVVIVIENVMVISPKKGMTVEHGAWLEFGANVPEEVVNLFSGVTRISSDNDEEIAKVDAMNLPDEIWLHIMTSIQDYSTLKSLRAVNSRLCGLMHSVQSYAERGGSHLLSIRGENGFDQIRRRMSEDATFFSRCCSLALEIFDAAAHATAMEYAEVIPEPIQQRLSSCLSTLTLLRCTAKPPEFHLSSIVDQCTRVNRLTIGKCPDFAPLLVTATTITETTMAESVSVTDTGNKLVPAPAPAPWPNVRHLTLINDPCLSHAMADAILQRVSGLVELSVVGLRWMIPTTKRERKKTDHDYRIYWEKRLDVLTSVVLRHIAIHGRNLRLLDVSFHPYLADSSFLQELSNFRIRHGLHLTTLRVELCDIPMVLLARVLTNIPSIRTFAGSLEAYKCRHNSKYSSQYYKILTRTTMFNIQNLSLTHCKKLTCLCFLQGISLRELDISYNYDMHGKHLKLKYGGMGLWKFVCVANKQLGLTITELYLPNITWLDLSFSDAVKSQAHLTHICHVMRKLQVLKLSGTTVPLELGCLKSLKHLKELRLRACAGIRASEFALIAFPKLETLDLAETALDLAAVEVIASNCRLLRYFDARGCPALSLYRYSEEVRRFAFVGLNTVRMRKKRRPQLPSAHDSEVGEVGVEEVLKPTEEVKVKVDHVDEDDVLAFVSQIAAENLAAVAVPAALTGLASQMQDPGSC